MKAPDKIYIQPSTIDELSRQNIVYTKRLSDTSIEYIRKDALLEWAKKEMGGWSSKSYTAQGVKMGLTLVIDKIESL